MNAYLAHRVVAHEHQPDVLRVQALSCGLLATRLPQIVWVVRPSQAYWSGGQRRQVPIEDGAWSTDDGRQLGYARQEREQRVVERDAQRSVSTLQMDRIQCLIGMEVGTLGVSAAMVCGQGGSVRGASGQCRCRQQRRAAGRRPSPAPSVRTGSASANATSASSQHAHLTAQSRHRT